MRIDFFALFDRALWPRILESLHNIAYPPKGAFAENKGRQEGALSRLIQTLNRLPQPLHPLTDLVFPHRRKAQAQG